LTIVDRTSATASSVFSVVTSPTNVTNPLQEKIVLIDRREEAYCVIYSFYS
jgi:hypothetical protein